MTRDELLKLLQQHSAELHAKFGVKELYLFGSHARNEAREDSDVDFLVEFGGRPTFDGYMDLKFFLEDLLHKRIDLVTRGALRPRLRPTIERDAIHVA
ncbi:MAG: nucleotidyltransferase family protein [Gammaproteobacteria bacterium]|nr:nucleotidyltransferase family protein [Gammaproteobacteria bacterium]